MDKKEWQGFSSIFKEVLHLESNPVAVRCLRERPADVPSDKVRICRAILDVAAGKSVQIYKKNNACLGGAWHLGFHKLQNPNAVMMTKKFVVEGEKLFSSYEALDKLISQMEEVPDNSNSCFVLSPMDKTQEKPDLVIFVCNPEVACRLLTLLTFIDGVMPKIKIGGPTCGMVITYPLITGEANISFYDYTARRMCNVDKNTLLVSIPYKKIPQMIVSLDKCTAGKAKLEYPQGFREFIQKHSQQRP